MSFEKENCPLCGDKLIKTKSANLTNYDCQISCRNYNPLDMSSKNKLDKISHYSVTVATSVEIQRIYLLPYAIDTFGDKSRIYKLADGDYLLNNFDDTLKWSLIKEVGVIITLSEEKMREKIKTILLFL